MSKKAREVSASSHVIFCCQGSDCVKHGAHETFKTLRGVVREAGLKQEVQCFKSECTGLCKHGPIVVVCGPQGVTWYRKVKAKDAIALVQSHLVDGRSLSEKEFSD